MTTAPTPHRPFGSPSTVDPAEVERFTALAEEWWDPNGKFRPLHRLNPLRLAFIRDTLCEQFGRDPLRRHPLSGLRLLDVGCGGGLVAEPMARLGAQVTAIDAAEENIRIARLHAEGGALAIDYRHAAAEDLAAARESFDAVLALEIVEHVADRDSFLAACAGLLRQKGVLVIATLNRTPQSFLLAIVGAEYVLGWLPRGTHDWRRFVRPSELAAPLRRHGMSIRRLSGVSYSLLADDWRLDDDLSVNYFAVATKN